MIIFSKSKHHSLYCQNPHYTVTIYHKYYCHVTEMYSEKKDCEVKKYIDNYKKVWYLNLKKLL